MVEGVLSVMQIKSDCIKLPPLLPAEARLLGNEDCGDTDGHGGAAATCSPQKQGEPETAVIGPDYLLEYIIIALTCQ